MAESFFSKLIQKISSATGNLGNQDENYISINGVRVSTDTVVHSSTGTDNADGPSTAPEIPASINALAITGVFDVEVYVDPSLSKNRVELGSMAQTIEVKVQGHKLSIGNKENVSINNGNISMSSHTVTHNGGVTQVTVSNGSSRKNKSKKTTEGTDVVKVFLRELSDLTNSGIGDVSADLADQQQLKLKLSGTGTLTLSGQVQDLSATLSGIGSLRAAALIAQRITLQQSGTGDSTFFCDQSISGKISGIGDCAVYSDRKIEIGIKKSSMADVKYSQRSRPLLRHPERVESASPASHGHRPPRPMPAPAPPMAQAPSEPSVNPVPADSISTKVREQIEAQSSAPKTVHEELVRPKIR